MLFKTMGEKEKSRRAFFHAMGVTGASSERVARFMADNIFALCPHPPSVAEAQNISERTTRCGRLKNFKSEGVKELSLVAASSIGADLALYF